MDATRQAGVALQSFTAQSVLLPERFRVDCAFGGDRTVALSQLPGALYACCDDIRKPRPQTHIKAPESTSASTATAIFAG